MKAIKFLKDHAHYCKGDTVELGDFAANDLIERGIAEAKAAAKKTVIKTKELKTKKAKK